MRKQVTIAAVLALVALGASAQTRMEAIGPFTYEAIGATPTLKIRGVSAAAKSAQEQRATAPVRSDTRANTFTYDAVGATPHVEAKRPATAATPPLQPIAR